MLSLWRHARPADARVVASRPCRNQQQHPCPCVARPWRVCICLCCGILALVSESASLVMVPRDWGIAMSDDTLL
eukprot:410187-Prymnesium_polylepis.1